MEICNNINIVPHAWEKKFSLDTILFLFLQRSKAIKELDTCNAQQWDFNS